jgi:hypothetical protein
MKRKFKYDLIQQSTLSPGLIAAKQTLGHNSHTEKPVNNATFEGPWITVAWPYAAIDMNSGWYNHVQ